MNTRRIGVLGGMFDPVHLGHLQVASLALEVLALTQLRMVPCHLPNHRGPALASAEARMEMLRLATQHEPRIVVDERECLREGISYTVDTLMALRQEFPTATLVLVLGADAFAGLERWQRWHDLFTLAHVFIAGRPGEESALTPVLAAEVKARTVNSAAQLFATTCGACLFSRHLQVDISSTAVRRVLHDGGATTTLLPQSVRGYIDTHALYTGQSPHDF
jgi:nicotinate-nucleotide adenylyltransferase